MASAGEFSFWQCNGGANNRPGSILTECHFSTFGDIPLDLCKCHWQEFDPGNVMSHAAHRTLVWFRCFVWKTKAKFLCCFFFSLLLLQWCNYVVSCPKVTAFVLCLVSLNLTLISLASFPEDSCISFTQSNIISKVPLSIMIISMPPFQVQLTNSQSTQQNNHHPPTPSKTETNG